MAAGTWNMQKASGGVASITVADGTTNTDLVLPESGTVATINNIVGFKNYVINGKKVVNQRGLTSTDNSYNQDRWYKAGDNWYHGIEGNNNLISGKTYTLIWSGLATASYYVGNATSSTINAQLFTSVLNGGSFMLTISAGQNLWIKFASDSTGSTFNFVQLEEGSVATPFENRPYGLELSLCQRYYEVLGTGIGQAKDATSMILHFSSSPKRVPATAILLNGAPYGESPINITAVVGVSSSIMTMMNQTTTTSGHILLIKNFSGMVAGSSASIAAGQIALSAEL